MKYIQISASCSIEIHGRLKTVNLGLTANYKYKNKCLCREVEELMRDRFSSESGVKFVACEISNRKTVICAAEPEFDIN